MNRIPPLRLLRGWNLEENVPRLAKLPGSLVLLTVLLLCAWPAAAQDWFRTGTGLGVEKPRVAVADFAPRSGDAQPHSKLFTDVVRDDLQFSGILDLVSPSFYPKLVPASPRN